MHGDVQGARVAERANTRGCVWWYGQGACAWWWWVGRRCRLAWAERTRSACGRRKHPSQEQQSRAHGGRGGVVSHGRNAPDQHVGNRVLSLPQTHLHLNDDPDDEARQTELRARERELRSRGGDPGLLYLQSPSLRLLPCGGMEEPVDGARDRNVAASVVECSLGSASAKHSQARTGEPGTEPGIGRAGRRCHGDRTGRPLQNLSALPNYWRCVLSKVRRHRRRILD